MVHKNKRIGRNLKTKFRRCVILPIDNNIKLHTLTDNKIQTNRYPRRAVISLLC